MGGGGNVLSSADTNIFIIALFKFGEMRELIPDRSEMVK